MRRKIVSNDILLAEVAKMIAEGERVTILAKGQSMMPFIVGSRDSVELSRVAKQLECGDIILARVKNPARYVIHRIISIDAETITLMGDGNLKITEQCDKTDVVARIEAIIKPHKTINPNSRRYQQYAKWWRYLLPLRRYILALIRLFNKFR